MLHRYGIFSWWWAHSCPKHLEKSNKHMKKICAPSCFYLQKNIQGYTDNKTKNSPYTSCRSWSFSVGQVSSLSREMLRLLGFLLSSYEAWERPLKNHWQDRKRTHKVIQKRFRLTTIGAEKQYVLHIVSVCLCLSYPARTTHALYYIAIWGLSGCTTFFFFNYLINGTIFVKNLLHIKCVFWFVVTASVV